MHQLFFPFRYLAWHYSSAFREIVALWLNFAWFVTHFFSMPVHVRTLFAPWKRMNGAYERKGLEYLAETFVFNTISRVLGACVRLVLLVAGTLTLCLLSFLFWVALTVWIFLPFISLTCVLIGIILITL